MRNLLIYNPVSGKENGRMQRIGNIIYNLTKDGDELVVYQTQKKGDAIAYCLEITEDDYDKIICCGGDGTFHEVMNGILEMGLKLPLGYIPLGSTNDYAKNLGINSRNVFECIRKKNVCHVDVGKFNGEYFSYVAAFGAFTDVSYTTPQKIKNSLGYLAYLLEGIKSLPDIKTYHVKCIVDNQEIEDDFLIGMITNAFSVAGIKNRGGENTRLDDGMMEYIFIKMPQNVLDFQPMISALLSSKIDERYMYFGQTKSLKIHSDMMQWTLDGEAGDCCQEVAIETCNRKLPIIVGDKFQEDCNSGKN